MTSAAASVTVLIVNYKVYDELAGCLAALAADLDGATADVVVVDHESDERQLAEAIKQHPRAVGIARRENRGFAAGVNLAASRTSSDLLLMLNPDSRLQPGALRVLREHLALRPDVVAVGPKVLSEDTTVQATGRTFPTALTGLFGRTTIFTRLWPDNPLSQLNLPSASTSAPIEVDWVAGTCVLIRASAFRDVGGFDERFFLYWEDADLCYRLRARGGRITYEPAAVLVHSLGKSSARARARSLVAFHRSALRYYGKHHRGPSRVVALPVAAVALGARLAFKLMALPFSRSKSRALPPAASVNGHR
jgi:N-acetylglucosaminyl-diphospho-decaprenol L-rhamnosyltransferase